MPVDDFQAAILKTLAPNRSPDSAVADDSALHKHGWRLSNDVDVFNQPDADVMSSARRDIERLKANGFAADVTKAFEGFAEAIVSRGSEGMTSIQWVTYSGYNFFPPVADEEFGFRLSFVDLAINKVIAAASRREPRDMLDLRFVGRVALPLWNAINAAPGKDDYLTPLKTIAMIRRNAQYAPRELAGRTILPDGFEPRAFMERVRRSLDVAERQIRKLPAGLAGNILMDVSGRPLRDPDLARDSSSFTIRPAHPGPVWPSGPDLDRVLVSRMIRHFGRHGAKLWERAAAKSPDRPGA